MKIKLLNRKQKRNDFRLALNNDVFKIDNWITDGNILIDTDIIDVVANVRSDNLDSAKEYIEKWTNKETLEEVLKEENEVEVGSFAYKDVRLMYHLNENIKEIINEFYVNQFIGEGVVFSYYDDSFYIFDIVDWIEDEEDYEEEEEQLYLQLVGILKKCEAIDQTLIPTLWNLEQQQKGLNNDR